MLIFNNFLYSILKETHRETGEKMLWVLMPLKHREHIASRHIHSLDGQEIQLQGHYVPRHHLHLRPKGLGLILLPGG